MPSSSTLAVFLIAALALLVVPGPAVLYIVARGIDQGRSAAFASAAGIAGGSLVHVAAAALGLSALVASSAVAFSTVKWLGAGYLVFLGIRTLLREPHPEAMPAQLPRSRRRIFLQGVAVQILNPKMALFFLAFLPQFVDPARGSVPLQTLALGGQLVGMGLCTDSTYALVAGSAGAWLGQNTTFLRSQRYVSGTVFIGLGVTAAPTGQGKH
ncbi:MAG: LysE family translocator [Thermomicrobiales bacterium]|nr:LysE family translocator [Thermomicrobiales bacterium]